MTNPTDREAVAPERIWAEQDTLTWVEAHPEETATDYEVEYIRADLAEAEKQAAVKAMREAAAKWHDARVVEIKRQIEENNEYCAREGLTHSAANDYCRDSILNSRVAAQQIRSLPAHTDALDRAIESVRREEREACAKVADAETGWNGKPHQSAMQYGPGIGRRIAAAIRARSDKGET